MGFYQQVVEHRYGGAYLQRLFSCVCVLWDPVHNFSTLHPQRTEQIPEYIESVTCIKHSELETVSNKCLNSVPKCTLCERRVDEIPASKVKVVMGFLGCTSCLKMEQLPKNVIRSQNLLQSKTSAWRDPIFIPLKHSSSKRAVKTQLSVENTLLAKPSCEGRTARPAQRGAHTARRPAAEEPPLTFATPTPVNLASSSSCRRGSRLCSSSIISAAAGQQHCDYAKQRREMSHSETAKGLFRSVSTFLQEKCKMPVQ